MLRREIRRRRRLAAFAVLLAAVAVFLTVRASPVFVSPPAASVADAFACGAVVARLPVTLDHDGSRPVTPASTLTAAWGRPAITLTCGLPAVAHPVSASTVCLGGAGGTCAGGVAWFQDVFDGSLWVTRVAPRIAVRIPASDGFADVLGPISAAVLGHPGA